jgi:hypothetical protein
MSVCLRSLGKNHTEKWRKRKERERGCWCSIAISTLSADCHSFCYINNIQGKARQLGLDGKTSQILQNCLYSLRLICYFCYISGWRDVSLYLFTAPYVPPPADLFNGGFPGDLLVGSIVFPCRILSNPQYNTDRIKVARYITAAMEGRSTGENCQIKLRSSGRKR